MIDTEGAVTRVTHNVDQVCCVNWECRTKTIVTSREHLMALLRISRREGIINITVMYLSRSPKSIFNVSALSQAL